MNAEQFRDIFHVLHNIDRMDLVSAGVIWCGGAGNKDWTRFNNDIGTFVLKLRQENLESLFELVRSRLPILPSAEDGEREMNIRSRTPLRLVEPVSAEVRVIGKLYSLRGTDFKTMVGDRCFWVGALTLKLLNSGYSPDELDLIEIDPDALDLED